MYYFPNINYIKYKFLNVLVQTFLDTYFTSYCKMKLKLHRI